MLNELLLCDRCTSICIVWIDSLEPLEKRAVHLAQLLREGKLWISWTRKVADLRFEELAQAEWHFQIIALMVPFGYILLQGELVAFKSTALTTVAA